MFLKIMFLCISANILCVFLINSISYNIIRCVFLYEVYDEMAMRYMLLHENNNCTYYSEYTRSNIAIITYAPGYNI